MFLPADYSWDSVDWRQPVNWNHGLNQGLVSWWLAVPNRMGFGSKTWRDMVPQSSHHGALNASMDPVADWAVRGQDSQAGLLRGQFGYLITSGSADGSGDRVEVGAVPAITTLNRMSCEAWVQPQVGTGRHDILGQWVSGGYHFMLSYGVTAAKFSFYVESSLAGSSFPNATSSSTYTSKTGWYHVVGTYDKSNVLLYVNGAQVGSTAFSNDLTSTSTEGFEIGGSGDDGGNHIISCVRLWKRALSAGEVASLYSDAKAGFPQLLNRVPRRTYSIPAAAVGGSIWELNPSGTASSANVWALGP